MRMSRLRGLSRVAVPIRLVPVGLVAAVSLTLLSAQEQPGPNSPFAPLPPGGQWTYQLHIPKPTRVPVDAQWVGMEGLLGSSVTHGMLRRDAGTWPVLVSINELESPSVAKAVVGKELADLFFAPVLSETRLQLSRRTNTTSMLELRGTVQMKDSKVTPIVLAQGLAALPIDGKTRVEEGAWIAEPTRGPIEVPAGRFNDLIHSRITKPAAGQYTVAHVVESWLARNVGLIKLAVVSTTGEAFYTIELTSYKLK